jgi:hypothetical protein
MKYPRTSAVVALLLASGAAILAARTQVARPGEIPRPEVWIQNGRDQPVPVSLHDVDGGPIRVTVWNGDPGSAPSPPVPVRAVRPTWEYQTVHVTPDTAAAALNRLGDQGWETTGIAWPGQDGTTLLMKRTH